MTAAQPKRARHPALPLEQWPAADQEAWSAAIRPKKFLKPAGKGAEWRPASRRSAIGAYGRWLAWASAQGADLAGEAPPRRMTAERLELYALFLLEGRSTVTAASTFGVLCMAVIAMFPDEDWGWLRAMQKQLHRQAKPSRVKRLAPAHKLFQLGVDLLDGAAATLDRARDAEMTPQVIHRAARDSRDGLIIALLASRPLRIKNLTAMEIGTHVRQTSTRTTIEFRGEETKTGASICVAWPEELLPALGRYLREVRPMLIAAPPTGGNKRPLVGPGARLWVGQGGTALSPGGLNDALERHTEERFGVPMTAHRFRDSVATTIVDQDPSQLNLAAQMLGHKRLTTTERHYVEPETANAYVAHCRRIGSLRQPHRRVAALRRSRLR